MTLPPALVLTAGLGTRLLPLTRLRAKGATPVAGVPLVERVLMHLAQNGVRSAVLNLHHLPESIARVVGDGAHLGLGVRYSWEGGRLLGSAGGPRHALTLMGEGSWLIVNGDTLCDIALAGLVNAHRVSGALVTLAVIPHEWPGRYRQVVVENDDTISGFTEAPTSGPAWHFVGIQVADASVFASLPDNQPAETVAGVYQELIAQKPGSVRAWRTSGAFADIGTPRDYLATNLDVSAGEGGPLSRMGHSTLVSPSARLHDCVLWDQVAVGDRAVLERCIVLDDVRIPADSRFADVVIAPTRLGGADLGPTRVEGELLLCPIVQ